MMNEFISSWENEFHLPKLDKIIDYWSSIDRENSVKIANNAFYDLINLFNLQGITRPNDYKTLEKDASPAVFSKDNRYVGEFWGGNKFIFSLGGGVISIQQCLDIPHEDAVKSVAFHETTHYIIRILNNKGLSNAIEDPICEFFAYKMLGAQGREYLEKMISFRDKRLKFNNKHKDKNVWKSLMNYFGSGKKIKGVENFWLCYMMTFSRDNEYLVPDFDKSIDDKIIELKSLVDEKGV